jgi:hypothetical protein
MDELTDIGDRVQIAQTVTAAASGVGEPDPYELKFLHGPQPRGFERHKAFGIFRELVRGFRRIHFLAPCVTVFGSARLGETSPYYPVAREIGRLLVDVGRLRLVVAETGEVPPMSSMKTSTKFGVAVAEAAWAQTRPSSAIRRVDSNLNRKRVPRLASVRSSVRSWVMMRCCERDSTFRATVRHRSIRRVFSRASGLNDPAGIDGSSGVTWIVCPGQAVQHPVLPFAEPDLECVRHGRL